MTLGTFKNVNCNQKKPWAFKHKIAIAVKKMVHKEATLLL